jgi:hypothetical protein
MCLQRLSLGNGHQFLSYDHSSEAHKRFSMSGDQTADEKERDLAKEVRQLQIDLMSERILRINFQMQLLGVLRQETQQKLESMVGKPQ